MNIRKMNSTGGFSLVELIVGAAIFALISVAIYQSYTSLISLVSASKVKVIATDVLNEQFELVRNLPFTSVGLVNGIPLGVLSPTETIIRGSETFFLTRTIRNIDDPFDGTIGGSPNDLSPADYKLVELTLECPNCRNFVPLSVVSRVAPKNLETASTNGALFIKVFDANGQPIQGANIHVENNVATTTIIINDVTDATGTLQIVDAPPGVNAYEITATKSGYSTDRTYSSTVGNPNPTKPHATVALQQVTQVSFIIDKVSTINISTISNLCATVPSVNFSIKGSKLIGTSPDLYKYDQLLSTNSNGAIAIQNVEWDTYSIQMSGTTFSVEGVNPLLPVAVLPDATQDIQLVLSSHDPSHLLVTVKDSATSLPLSGAEVTLSNGGAFSETLTTGRGFLEQTDWSGGGGQADYTDLNRYLSSDGNIDTTNPAGELKLHEIFGVYAPSGSLTSSTFDTGTTSNFNQISWTPTNQPPETGSDNVRFQIATAPINDESTTWSYLGPDGSSGTFFGVSDANINSVHNGDRYFRYRINLATANTAFTPNVANVALTFTSSCIPPGQAMFSNLSADLYSIEIEKAGYISQVVPITIDGVASYQQEIILITQ